MTTLSADSSATKLRPHLQHWSAAPTPFSPDGSIDVTSVRRSIDHHVATGCEAIMLGGTCGEGPWLRHSDLEILVRTGVEQAEGRLKILVQVTDNSPGLILDRLDAAAAWGADRGVLAQPHFFMNATPARLRDFYLEVWEKSPLPTIFYDRGAHSTVSVPTEILTDILHHPKVVGVKDSASAPERFALTSGVRNQRPELIILAGNEFQLISSLESGYDGAFFGGMILTAPAVKQTMDLLAAGETEAARKLDEETQQFLFDVYGGPKITCWLSGLKYTLVKMGIFSEWNNIPGFPLTDECRQAIDRAVAETDWLRP